MPLPQNAIVGGKYRIGPRVGEGGMGEVYRAVNLQNNRPVAVKALLLEESETALARFRQEAVIQYNLRHPNVAELFEYFEFQGRPCIAMEFVEGKTLDACLRESGALEVDRALEILADICDAVSFMHSKGTIHRDIKSENIRVTSQGKAKLLDFGISISKTSPALTKMGYSIGTPEKMAPEQHRGLRGDARSDVWALGVLLYEMVSGATPFTGASVREDILAVRYVPVARRKPGIPKAVAGIIGMCLKVKPDERYASAGVMLRDVQRVRRNWQGGSWAEFSAPKPALIAGVLAAVAAVLLIYAIVLSSETKSLVPFAGESRPPESSQRPETLPPSSQSSRSVAHDADFVLPSPQSPSIAPARSKPTVSPNGPIVEPFGLPEAQTDQRTIQIATYDGPAEVVRDGRVVGVTPYPLRGPLNRRYELELRRTGYETRKVEVQINATKNEYLFGLTKNETGSDFGKRD